jgi:hypothetical protein
MAQKYLVRRTKQFFWEKDREDGATDLFITENERYSKLTDAVYNSDAKNYIDHFEPSETEEEFWDYINEECIKDEERQTCYDGYSGVGYTFVVTPVTDEEADVLNKIIREYQSI